MNRKSCLLLVVWMLSFILACSRDKNPISADLPVINPDGKAISDFGTSMYMSPDGTLWSWGKNLSGQAGQGTTEPVNSPTVISSLDKVIDFDTREGVSLAADAAGNIWAWGWWAPSAVYADPALTPQIIAKLPGVIQVDISGHLLRNDGAVWKVNTYSQNLYSMQTPEKVPGTDDIVNISGDLAVRNNGDLADLSDYLKTPEFGGYTPIAQVSQVQNSINHSVVLKTDGTVWAWGQNNIGELGNGTNGTSAAPVRVSGLDQVVQISVRYHFNLALKKDGSVWFWGHTGLRDEYNAPCGIYIPERVETAGPVSYIQAGVDCILIQNDGTLWTFSVKDRIVHKIAM